MKLYGIIQYIYGLLPYSVDFSCLLQHLNSFLYQLFSRCKLETVNRIYIARVLQHLERLATRQSVIVLCVNQVSNAIVSTDNRLTSTRFLLEWHAINPTLLSLNILDTLDLDFAAAWITHSTYTHY